MRFQFIYDGYASLNGTPDHLVPKLDPTRLCDAQHGLSGTEVHMFGTAQELVRRGHEVQIYGAFTNSGPIDLSYDRVVSFWPLTELANDVKADVAIAYHDARPLAHSKAKRKFAHHQTYGLSPQEDATQFADGYFTATGRVAQYHRDLRGWDVRVVPNAWDYGQHQPWQPVPGRLIWNTGFERGFHRLLEVLPAIIERCPEAHVIAFTRGGSVAAEQAEVAAAALNERFPIGGYPQKRITIYPTASRNDVLRTVATASCFAYPCDVPSPTECWPMSVHDCMATGVPVVLAPDDGLEELFGANLVRTPGIKRFPEAWRDSFVNAVANVLGDLQLSGPISATGQEWARSWTFERSVNTLLGHLASFGIQ